MTRVQHWTDRITRKRGQSIVTSIRNPISEKWGIGNIHISIQIKAVAVRRTGCVRCLFCLPNSQLNDWFWCAKLIWPIKSLFKYAAPIQSFTIHHSNDIGWFISAAEFYDGFIRPWQHNTLWQHLFCCQLFWPTQINHKFMKNDWTQEGQKDLQW